jgi:hypothetical protein
MGGRRAGWRLVRTEGNVGVSSEPWSGVSFTIWHIAAVPLRPDGVARFCRNERLRDDLSVMERGSSMRAVGESGIGGGEDRETLGGEARWWGNLEMSDESFHAVFFGPSSAQR